MRGGGQISSIIQSLGERKSTLAECREGPDWWREELVSRSGRGIGGMVAVAPESVTIQSS